jgi:hypothetical protein
MLLLRTRIPSLINRLLTWAVEVSPTSQQSKQAGLLVLSLIIPWTILLLMVEAHRLERLWWLWPPQVIMLAAAVTYVPRRFRAPRPVGWVGSALLISLLVGNPLTLSRMKAWLAAGWSGPDAQIVETVDYVANHLRGKKQAAIGYHMVIHRFVATFNAVDPRYKVGADVDLLFQHRHGISNTDRCAEGASHDDEFRIVRSRPNGTPAIGRGYIDIPLDSRFHLVQRFGPNQVLRRN